ncbi:hypothetical protein [Paraburkholderia sp. MM5477-R1]|uniref:hypothetical protein n=1 Tax=Paraburkholderia sp. MM5477-R1 TaxID=2991062 RepID=UPI003D1AADDB
MNDSLLADQATRLLDGVEGGSAIAPVVLPRLPVFFTHLDSAGVISQRLESIPACTFGGFVEYLEASTLPDDEIHLTLASVRMVLCLAGIKDTDLQILTAPRVRKRQKNQGGKYQFATEKRSLVVVADSPLPPTETTLENKPDGSNG